MLSGAKIASITKYIFIFGYFFSVNVGGKRKKKSYILKLPFNILLQIYTNFFHFFYFLLLLNNNLKIA